MGLCRASARRNRGSADGTGVRSRNWANAFDVVVELPGPGCQDDARPFQLHRKLTQLGYYGLSSRHCDDFVKSIEYDQRSHGIEEIGQYSVPQNSPRGSSHIRVNRQQKVARTILQLCGDYQHQCPPAAIASGLFHHAPVQCVAAGLGMGYSLGRRFALSVFPSAPSQMR